MPHAESDAELGVARVPWDSDDPEQSVLDLYAHNTDFARTKIRWYLSDAEAQGRYARRVRFAAILLGTLGVALPLVDNALPQGAAQVGPWGYVAIALAAGLFSLDRFGGFSWRWTRSTVIWVTLRRELAAFQHDWNMLMLNPRGSIEQQITALKEFRQDVEVIIAQECRDWADMTIHARLELEETLQRDLGRSNVAPQ